MSATPLHDEPTLPDPTGVPSSPSPLDGPRPADRRFLAGCVTGLLVGVALAVPVAYALVRVDGPPAQAASPAEATSTSQVASLQASAPSSSTRAASPTAGSATPGSAEQLATMLSAGLGALAEKNPTRALELFQAAERAFPQNARVQNNLCVALNELGRFAEAVGHCKRALTLEPALTLAQRNLHWAEAQLAKASSPTDTPRASR